MNEKDIDQVNRPEDTTPEILVNEYGTTRDSAVVVDEADRTVLLTGDETIIIEKEQPLDIAPKDRPRKVYTGMWGPTEIATAGLALLAVLSVILLYIFVVVPSNRDLEQKRATRDRLSAERDSARAKYGDITNTETRVAKLTSSIEDFESRYLPVSTIGRTSLYQRLNGLISAYGLVNTSGPDYSPLEIADEGSGGESDRERGRAKFRSLFPGVYVTMTLEGPYQNLRRFIREIETGNEFVVISAVELEPSDSSGERENNSDGSTAMTSPTDPGPMGFPGMGQPAPQQAQPRRPRGKTHGETVNLRLEMAAYFRRASAAPPAPIVDSQ